MNIDCNKVIQNIGASIGTMNIDCNKVIKNIGATTITTEHVPDGHILSFVT
jgi:type II secretory pathway component HofQ